MGAGKGSCKVVRTKAARVVQLDCLKRSASHKAFAFNTDLSRGKRKRRGGSCSRQALCRKHLCWRSPAQDAVGCSLLPLILRPLSVHDEGRIRREHNNTIKQNQKKLKQSLTMFFVCLFPHPLVTAQLRLLSAIRSSKTDELD